MESPKNIRNFCILAHVDHGKSTLADRFLEITGTVPKNKMRPQYLDQLESERERGITIKMAPVRMLWQLQQQSSDLRNHYILNLIDTPGHSDFSYEVSRALAAVEGAILLVDATQGLQAQTLANFEKARDAGLQIIGAVTKIDIAASEQIETAIKELSNLLQTGREEISLVSGKTGEGVPEILAAVIKDLPAPSIVNSQQSIVIFDSFYDEHRGIIASVRIFSGELRGRVGYFAPELKSAPKLVAGEIGYVITGEKNPAAVKIGGGEIKKPAPVVFVSFYPENLDDYEKLRQALGRLELNDAALSFEPETSEALGRGFKGGFLGRLHFEITAERLEKEFGIKTVHGFPAVAYKFSGGRPTEEPIIRLEILTPPQYLGAILSLQEIFRLSHFDTRNLGSRVILSAKLPLTDLISDFDDKLKSLSNGYASLSYEIVGYEKADLEKLEILIAGHLIPALARILPEATILREARQTVERLKKILPRRPYVQAIQAAARGRIIARETIPALRKDVTGYLYGGDRSRKMKLWKKQQKGKARLKTLAQKTPVIIQATVLKELLKK